MRGWNALRKFVGKPYRDKRTLVGSLLLVVFFRIALKVTPFSSLMRIVHNGTAQPSEVTGNGEVEERVVRSVLAVSSRILRDRPCLTQALAAKYLLTRHGINTVLQIGVMKNPEGKLLAHAWLERNGRVIIGGSRSPHVYRVLPAVEFRHFV